MSSRVSDLPVEQAGLASKAGRLTARPTARVAYVASVIAVIVLFAVALRYDAITGEELTKAAMARRFALAELAAATLSERLERMTDLARALATRARLREGVAAGRWEAAVLEVSRVPEEFPYVERLFLSDVDGTLMADAPALPGTRGRNFAFRDWYQGVSRAWETHVSELYQRAAPPQRELIAVASPVRDGRGEVLGILVMQLGAGALFDWAEEVDLAPGASLSVLDAKGNAAYVTGVLAPQPAEEMVYASMPARHDWSVVIAQPASTLFAARERQLRSLRIGYAVIALLLCAGAAFALYAGRQRGRQLRQALARHSERLRILHQIDAAIVAQHAPETIAETAIQPLRALLGVPRAIVNKFDLAAGEAEWIAAAGRQRTHVGPGVRYPIAFMGDVEGLRRGEMQRIDVHTLPPGPDAQALLDSGVHRYLAVPMIAGGELIGALSFGGGEELSAEQAAIAQEAATQLAIAIAQARLREQLSGQARELERRVEERTAALEAARRELEDLYDNAPCGYHSVDANGLIVRMNQTWLSWLGYTREEVVGKMHHPELMTPQSAARFRHEAFPLFRRQGWLKEVEFDYVRKDGGTFPGSLQTVAVYDAAGCYVMSRTVVVDVSARKQMEERLREANAFLDSVIENIPHMIFVKDAAELRFVRLNRAGERLLGRAKEALIGRNDYDFFPREEADFFTGKDREVLGGAIAVDIPEEPIHTPGGRRILHTKKIPLLDEAGDARYLLGISEDITDRKAAEDRIRALNAQLIQRANELEAANKELDSFSYSVSHDLRAPLRAVDGYARMLEEDYGEHLDAEPRRLLATVRSSAAQMARLIDDLLAFSRLGRKPITATPVDMGALARQVLDELSGEYPGADVALAELPPAHGDAVLLKQVWLNLIANALKYSAKSRPPRVEIGARAAEAHLEYWVRDNGVGFDMRYAGKLFGVFQRLHRADEFPGTGVGLAIVHRVIGRHGGEVSAEAAPNEGACFRFTLPKETA